NLPVLKTVVRIVKFDEVIKRRRQVKIKTLVFASKDDGWKERPARMTNGSLSLESKMEFWVRDALSGVLEGLLSPNLILFQTPKVEIHPLKSLKLLRFFFDVAKCT
ncbi:hypothetical protein HAX54_028073, partial [Datura stramonium]|nr:hypothetical protein [Datura stramonium]